MSKGTLAVLFLIGIHGIDAHSYPVNILPWATYENRPCILLKLNIKNGTPQWAVPSINFDSISNDTEIIKQFKKETGQQLSPIADSALSPLVQGNNDQKIYALRIEYRKSSTLNGAIDWTWCFIDNLLQYTNLLRYTLSDISGKNMLNAANTWQSPFGSIRIYDELKIDPLLVKLLQTAELQVNFQSLGIPIALPKVIVVNDQILEATRVMNNKIYYLKGYFTPTSLKEFLVRSYHKNFIHNQDFANDNPMHIYQPIGLKHGCTDQTFIVEIYGKPKYFIRKMASFTEAVRLTYTLTINEINPFKQKNKPFPVLCLPDYLFTYFYNGTYHFLSILPYAPGYTLGQLIDQYRSCKINDATIANVFKHVGNALAHFHNYFIDKNCNTITHGDCNLDNIIINEDNTVYFIDLESLIRSYLVGKPAHEDIVNLITLAIHYYLKIPDENGTLPLKLLSLICTNLLHSYISNIKLDKQKIMWDKIIDHIKNTNNFPHHKPTLLQAIAHVERSVF